MPDSSSSFQKLIYNTTTFSIAQELKMVLFSILAHRGIFAKENVESKPLFWLI